VSFGLTRAGPQSHEAADHPRMHQDAPRWDVETSGPGRVISRWPMSRPQAVYLIRRRKKQYVHNRDLLHGYSEHKNRDGGTCVCILSFPNRLSNCEIWSSSPRETEREHSMWARTGTRAGSRGAFATQAGPGTGGPNTITRSRVPTTQQWALKLSPRFIRTIERPGGIPISSKNR
jgi:hypothetical protein